MSALNKLFSMEIMHADAKQENVNLYLNASDSLTKAVASAQGSDGVSGVSRRILANKIAYDLYWAMDRAYNVSTEIINEAAMRLAGIETKKGTHWEWCVILNNTYKDCPISSRADSKKLNMIVATFNPGTHYVNHTKIGVPHGNWTVHTFNTLTNKFDLANATVLCDAEIKTYDSCWLYTEYVLNGHEIGFMQVAYNASNDLTAQLAAKTAKFENSQQFIQYKGLDEEHGSMFLVQKKNYINNYLIGIDLRYYKSY